MNNNTYIPEIYSERNYSNNKEQIDSIRDKIFLLNGMDKLVMTLYMEKNMSFRQIALLLDMNPSTVSRKIKRIIRKLTKGIFIVCQQQSEYFTSEEMSIARDYFLRGLSIRKIADNKNTSFHRIRQKIQEIQHMTTQF